MKYKNYLFDLDGTLTDPGIGIKNSIRYALKKFKLPDLCEDTLNLFIGPPLLDSFEKYCGVSADDSKKLLALYREYFSEIGIFENTVYDGIPETLAELKNRGGKLYLATSKPEIFAEKILNHFDLAKYFDFIGGSTLDEKRTAKDEVIAYVLENTGINKDESIMVGDRKYDIIGAHKCGLCAVGVLFGYGNAQELADAEYIIERPVDLLKL